MTDKEPVETGIALKCKQGYQMPEIEISPKAWKKD